MSATKFSGFIFDFNGVIVDDYVLQKEAWDQISLKLRGKITTDAEMRQTIRGVPTEETIRSWLPAGSSEASIVALAQEKTQAIEQLFTSSPLFRLNVGLENFLDDLKKEGIARLIVTSQTRAVYDFAFDKLGLQRWFTADQVVCFDGTYPGKPAPDPYLLGADKLRLPPAACIVAEDALSGIASAQAAGIGMIIAVGSEEQLAVLRSLPSVSRTIHNFSEITVQELFS